MSIETFKEEPPTDSDAPPLPSEEFMKQELVKAGWWCIASEVPFKSGGEFVSEMWTREIFSRHFSLRQAWKIHKRCGE